MGERDKTHPKECEVFIAAAEIEDPARLAAFLDEACGDDEHLRSRVAILLKHDRESTDDDLEPPEPWVGEAIRDYKAFASTRVDLGSKNRPSSGSRSGQGGWIPPSTAEMNGLIPAFDIEMLIGRGGMGAVYKGEQTSLQRAVAIKILSALRVCSPNCTVLASMSRAVPNNISTPAFFNKFS